MLKRFLSGFKPNRKISDKFVKELIEIATSIGQHEYLKRYVIFITNHFL